MKEVDIIMVIEINKYYKEKTIYECDRCKAKVHTSQRKGIYITNETGQPNKRWDLCMNCFKLLERGIAKGIKKE